MIFVHSNQQIRKPGPIVWSKQFTLADKKLVVKGAGYWYIKTNQHCVNLMSKRNIFAAYLSLSSPLSDERRSLRRYLGPRRSESFITVVEGTDLVYFTLVCILTFFPPVAIFFSLRILRSHAQSICSNCFRAKIYVTRNYGTLLSFQNWT